MISVLTRRSFSGGMEPMLTTYNSNSALQETCQRIGNPILEKFSTALDLKASGGRIAEFGCSGGRNSIEPVKTIVGNTPNGAVFEAILEDLPTNPWHQVTEIVDSHRVALPHVRFLCAGTSFYEPVCAPKSLDLAYSYVSVHFLSNAPPLKDHLIYHESQDAQAQKLWSEQAASDWERLLLLRANEMKPGGKLLLSTMGRCNDDGYSWKIFSSAVWEAMLKCSPDILSPDELALLRIPTSLRNEQEILAPFQSNGGSLSKVFSVDHLEFAFTDVGGEKDDNPQQLASLYRRRIEAVWGGLLINQLVENGRKPEDAAAAMTKVWNEFETMVERDAGLGWLFMQCYYLQLTRL